MILQLGLKLPPHFPVVWDPCDSWIMDSLGSSMASAAGSETRNLKAVEWDSGPKAPSLSLGSTVCRQDSICFLEGSQPDNADDAGNGQS